MDPYLEHTARWPGVHNSLITAIRDVLSPAVAPTYYVDVESRAYVMAPDGQTFVGRPDVAVVSPVGVLPGSYSQQTTTADVLEVEVVALDEVNHTYLTIREVGTHTLVTMIEILSPVNKVNKRGRDQYLNKREDILASRTNLVEIDLLRIGEPLPLLDEIPQRDYRILVCRSGGRRARGHLYAFDLQAQIPDVPIPLFPGDDEPTVPLNQLVHDLYTRARYDLRIDYSQPPAPPLREENRVWAAGLLATD